MAPATYHSGTPRAQHPAVARWHAHLRGLAMAIHEISGLTLVEEGVIDLLSLLESPGQFHMPQGSKIPLEFTNVYR
jgi:hypothetical protein